MTSYKIENFFGHLTQEQTIEAVAHGLSLLNLEGIIQAISQGVPAADLEELAGRVSEQADSEEDDA